MTIKEQLLNDMKEAMRAHDSNRLGVIRFLMSEIKNHEIDGGATDDTTLQKVIASQVKKSKDAVADFLTAQRQDLVDDENAKISVMEAYLPAQLSDEKLEKIVKEIISAVGENKNPGQLIGAVVKQVAGQADGARISAMIKKITTKN